MSSPVVRDISHSPSFADFLTLRMTEWAGLKVLLQTHTGYRDCGFRDFPHSLQINVGTVYRYVIGLFLPNPFLFITPQPYNSLLYSLADSVAK